MSPELIKSYVDFFASKGTEVTDIAAEAAIADWEAGRGELLAELVNGSELWKPVVASYFAALGQPVPETVGEPIVEVLSEPASEEALPGEASETKATE